MKEKDVDELALSIGTLIEKILKVVIPKEEHRKENDKLAE